MLEEYQAFMVPGKVVGKNWRTWVSQSNIYVNREHVIALV